MKTTLALIGEGKWGKNYVRTINSLQNCVLPAKYIKTRNYEDLFAQKDIDGVIIATPSSTHFSVARDFLERGFNVLIEKPLTTSYREAVLLKKMADKGNSVAMVGHIFLYHPAIIQMKKQLKKIGKIMFILTESMDFGPIRTDVSSLWDWAPHDISIVINLLENFPVAVSAWAINALTPKTNLHDMCFLKLSFPNNVTVIISLGWLSPVKKRNIVVVGEKGSLVFDDTQAKKLIHIVASEDKKEVFYPKYSGELPLTAQVLEFIDSIDNKRKPKTDIDAGVAVIKVIEEAENSIRTSK